MDTTETPPTNTRHRRRHAQGRRSNTDRWGLISDGMLVVVVVGSALAIGTVHIPVLLAVSALALIGATFELVALRRVPWPATVLAGFGLFSALQAISLPAAWIKLVSPVSADVWLRCLVPFGEPALRSFPLSLDPSASIAEALKWLTYASVYVMAMRTRVRHGSAWLAVLLFGSVTLVSLITLVHGIADLPELYGLYHPDFAPGRWNVGPLLNSNNLAGYAILGLFTGGGLLLTDRSPLPRLALMIGVGSITAALALSGSRAGVVSVLVAGIVALVWLLRAKGARISARSFGVAMAPLAIGIAIAVALGTEHEAGQFNALDVERKVSVWLWSLPMIREHALFGVGRGAFETAFAAYRGALDYDWAIVVTHAENFVVQWIAEWGVPVGLCAVVVIVGYVLREWYQSRSDRLRFMVLTGLLALFLQNFADLGLEVPALVIAAVVALAAGERATPAPAVEVVEAAKRLGRRVVFAAIPACALWVVALLWSRSPVEFERREMSVRYGELAMSNADELATPKTDELALRRADELEMRRAGELEMRRAGELASADGGASGRADELGQFRNRLHQAVLRHPAEAFFPLLGGLVAMRTRDGSALTWLARALELAPTNGPVHLVLADLVHSHGATTQAMMHLRLAGQYDRTLGSAVVARAPAWAPSIDLLMQAIPDGPHGRGVLLEACAKEQAIEPRLDCFRRAAERSPTSVDPQLALAESLLAAIKSEEPPCKDALIEHCAAEAEAAIRSATRLDPKAWRPGYLLSKVLLARGDTAGAARLLTRTCPPDFRGDECWQEALVTAMKGGAIDAISTAANALAARQCDGMESCAKMFASLASMLESGGQVALASKFYIKAAEAEPSAARWLKVGEFAAQAHLNGVARAALERANRSFDASPTSRARVELLRQRVARTTAGPP
jgi:tetratricopeptide (TPR) repeat protein